VNSKHSPKHHTLFPHKRFNIIILSTTGLPSGFFLEVFPNAILYTFLYDRLSRIIGT